MTPRKKHGNQQQQHMQQTTLLQEMQTHALSKKRKAEWHQKHDVQFALHGLTRPSRPKLFEMIADWPPMSCWMFKSLPLRAQEIIAYKSMLLEKAQNRPSETIVDVSQSIDWLPEAEGDIATCLTGSSQLWLMEARRLLLGPEAFAIMGGTKAAYRALDDEPNSLLLDLAGNMFNGPVCMAVLLITLCSCRHHDVVI